MIKNNSKNHLFLYLNTVFYPCFVLWYASEIVFRTNIEYNGILESGITYFVLVVLLIQDIFYQQYKKKEVLIILICSTPILASALMCKDNSVLSAWIFIISFQNCEFNRIVKYAYKVLSIIIPIIILLCLLGLIPDKILYRNNIVRHSLGFSHPNQLGLVVFQWLLCRVYLFWDKIGGFDFISLVVLSILIQRITDSQTATISILLLGVIVFAIKTLDHYKVSYNRILAKTFSVSSLFVMLASIYLTYIDVKKYAILAKIDFFLSRRFSMCHRVLSVYGYSWLGQRVYTTREQLASHREIQSAYSRLFLDNAYATLWLKYGVIVLIIFVVAYFFLYRKIYMTPSLLVILFVYSIYGIMEHGLFQMRHNVFLLLFSYLLYEDKQSDFIGSIDT